MNICPSIHRLGLALLMLSVCAVCGCTGGNDDGSGSASGGGGGGGAAGSTPSGGRSDGAKMSSDDKAAADFLRSKIEEHWLKGPDGWTTKFKLRNVFGQEMEGEPDMPFKQFRELSFTIEPEQLTEAQKLNGADYRAGVSFKSTPERVFRTFETFEGPQGWSSWRDGHPGMLLAVERRNGQWLVSDSDLWEGDKPDASAVPH